MGRASLNFFFEYQHGPIRTGFFSLLTLIIGPLPALVTRWFCLEGLNYGGLICKFKSPSENLTNVLKDCS